MNPSLSVKTVTEVLEMLKVGPDRLELYCCSPTNWIELWSVLLDVDGYSVVANSDKLKVSLIRNETVVTGSAQPVCNPPEHDDGEASLQLETVCELHIDNRSEAEQLIDQLQ